MSHKNGAAHQNGAPARPPVETELILAAIEPSPLNPRKRFDAARLAELTASVKLHGVLQPILVWQRAKGRRRYELIAGERRYRAAKEAGLAAIPAKILDVTEREARELRIIENDQREDLTTLERADGYAELVGRHGYTVESLAERVGKSAASVRELVKIARQLPKLAREALDAGRIAASTAGLIARVPGAQQREEAARFVLTAGDGHPRGGWVPSPADVKRAVKDGQTPLNFLETKELIGRRYMVELKTAPFDTRDADLVPEAGSCESCPYRTGNNREEYPDSRGDICTRPECYQEKLRAHSKQLLDRHREGGGKVLTRGEGHALFSEHDPHHLEYSASRQWVDLAEPCWDANGKTYRQALGDRLAGEVVVCLDRDDQAHELVPRNKAEAILRKQPKMKGSARPERSGRSREERERLARAKAGKVAARTANGLVAEQAQAMFARVLGFTQPDVDRLRALVRQGVDFAWSDAPHQVELRRGARAPGDHRDGGRSRDAVADLVDRANTAAELLGILAELIAARASLDWGGAYYDGQDRRAGDFWKAWGIDPKKLRKEAEQAAAAKNKTRSPKTEATHA